MISLLIGLILLMYKWPVACVIGETVDQWHLRKLVVETSNYGMRTQSKTEKKLQNSLSCVVVC